MSDPDRSAGIAALREEIAQHCASFFWNDVDIGLLHAKWREQLDALLAAPAPPSSCAGIPPEAIETLIAKWRADAEHRKHRVETEGGGYSSIADTLEECAEDLAALLSAQPQEKDDDAR